MDEPSDAPPAEPAAPSPTAEATAAVDGEAVYPVPHEALTRDHVPRPREPFDAVVRFAYTFDGYARFGMEMCAGIGNRAVSHFVRHGALPDWIEGDLDRLRAALYFEARRWILLGREPDARVLLYVRALCDAVEEVIAAPASGTADDAGAGART